MNQTVRIRIQSILFNNELASIFKTVVALSNSVRNYVSDSRTLDVSFVYGDASEKPLLDEESVKKISSILDPFVRFEYVFFNENTGSSEGHNRLSSNMEADYLLVMNPDIIMSPVFFENILSPMSDGKVGMVESRQTPIEQQKEYDKKTFETEWATTACTLIRASLFDELHGFDPQSFFLYCDDLDFSWRLRLAGYRIIYQPTAVVFHAKKLNNAGKWAPNYTNMYYSALGALMLAHKWSNPDRVKDLIEEYMSRGGLYNEVVNEYKTKEKKRLLPQPIDPEHSVAKFVGDYNSDNRFII